MAGELHEASTEQLLTELARRNVIPDSSEGRARRRIAALLAEHDLTQAELASRIGVSQKHVSQVLSGRAGLSFDMADRMLMALGRGPVVPEEVGTDG